MARANWRLDAAAVMIVGVFATWVLTDLFPPSWDAPLDRWLFLLAGGSVAWFQWRVAVRASSPSERLAWRLLSLASLVRIVSGAGWSLWLLQHGAAPRPWWMLIITSSALVLNVAGLLAFSAERRDDIDRVRLAIDVTIVSVGSALLLWAVALGPFFDATGAQAPRAEDYIYTISDALAALLAAVVYLRSGTRYMRSVAAIFLLAYLLQVVPDVLFWAGKTSYSYEPRDAIAVVWFAVWVLKGIAARVAERLLDRRDSAVFKRDEAYQSGMLPHVFLLSATMVLLLELAVAERADTIVSVMAATGLAVLLVTRQAVELRERARLQDVLHDEAEWYGALLRDAFDVVLLIDRDGRTSYVSPASTRLLGDAADLSTPWALLDRVHADDREMLRARIDAPGVENGGGDIHVRFRTDERDAWRAFDLHVEDRRDDRSVGAIVVNGHDVTGASSLTGRLHKAQELEALGVFAGGLSHDLNNILTVIDAHAELLLDDAPAGHVIRDDLAAVRVSAARAGRLTRGLLALSRRKVDTERNIDLGELVRERLEASSLDTRVGLRAADALPRVRVNSQAITLAVDALLLNVFETVPDDASLALSLSTRQVSSSASPASCSQELAPGEYVLLSMHGASPSFDNLALLMALAAIREVGGTLLMPTAEYPSVAMYVPTAGVA